MKTLIAVLALFSINAHAFSFQRDIVDRANHTLDSLNQTEGLIRAQAVILNTRQESYPEIEKGIRIAQEDSDRPRDHFDDELEAAQLQRDNMNAAYRQQIVNDVSNIGSNYLEQHKEAFQPQPIPFQQTTCRPTGWGTQSCY